MSFSINLQRNLSDYNVFDKTIQNIITLEGVLKQATSLINPVIVIEASLDVLKNCNYMTIDSFNRKYFVTDIKSVSDKLLEITAHVDVLSTYKNQIRNCRGIVEHQEKEYNLYLDDGTFRAYQNPLFNTVTFPSGFENPSFIMVVAGT